MVIKEKDMKKSERIAMRGGDKSVIFQEVVDPKYLLHSRLFSTLTLVPGSSIGPHVHSGEIEYYYILEGEGIVSEKDGDKTVRAGDVVITGWNNSHAIRNSGTENLKFLAVILLEK